MTKKERQEIKHKYLFINDRKDWNEDQKRLDKEIATRDMIDSIICYGLCDYDYVINDEYLDDYKKDLGEERVKELVQEQIDEKPYVERNVFTDNEGLTYNSLHFRDEEGYKEEE